MDLLKLDVGMTWYAVWFTPEEINEKVMFHDRTL